MFRIDFFFFGAPNCWSSAQRKFTSLSCRISFSETTGKWSGLEDFGSYPITKKSSKNLNRTAPQQTIFCRDFGTISNMNSAKTVIKKSCNIQSDTGLARRSAIFVKSLAKEDSKLVFEKNVAYLHQIADVGVGAVSSTKCGADAAAICQGCPATRWRLLNHRSIHGHLVVYGSVKGLGVYQIHFLVHSTTHLRSCHPYQVDKMFRTHQVSMGSSNGINLANHPKSILNMPWFECASSWA